MTPEERIEAFIADWHEAWTATAPLFDRTSADRRGGEVSIDEMFGAWQERLAGVAARHGDATFTLSSGSFSGHAEHAPGEYDVLDSSVTGPGRHRVITLRHGDPYGYRHRTFDLIQTGGDWRIASLVLTMTHPTAPIVEEPERSALTSSPSRAAELTPLEPGDPRDFAPLFAAGRPVRLDEQPSDIEVRDLGTVNLQSGAIVVADIGYLAHGTASLARSVPPGEYPVQVAIAFDRIAAVRVRFGAEPAQWRRASRSGGGDSVVSVDAGNVAIMDASAVAEVTEVDVEQIIAQFATLDRPPAFVQALAGHAQAVALVESGYGDGGYPVYWGLDADGRVAELLVDFLVLSEELQTRFDIPWQTGPAASTALDSRGVQVIVEEGAASGFMRRRREYLIRIRGASPERLAVVDEQGQRLVEFTDAQPHGDSEWVYRWTEASRPPHGSALRLTLPAGYRLI